MIRVGKEQPGPDGAMVIGPLGHSKSANSARISGPYSTRRKWSSGLFSPNWPCIVLAVGSAPRERSMRIAPVGSCPDRACLGEFTDRVLAPNAAPGSPCWARHRQLD